MFLFGVAKYLFSALSLTVVLAMLASYVVAMTVIPIYCARFLSAESARKEEHGGKGLLGRFRRAYERFADRYERFLNRALEHKRIVIASIVVLFIASLLVYPLLGTELFPTTDSGQFIIDYRVPAGTRIELTEAITA
jgi:multidrug efflux pump subunit AcrB